MLFLSTEWNFLYFTKDIAEMRALVSARFFLWTYLIIQSQRKQEEAGITNLKRRRDRMKNLN